jgi:ribosomal protein S28E/S33
MAGIIENGVVTVRFVTPMSVVSNQPVFVADTLSLKRQVLSQGVQRWEISTNLEPSNNSADFLLHSVTNGYDQVFDVQVPQVFKRSGETSTATTVRVNSLNAANSSTISCNVNGTLLKGEFIKFTNHDKVYILLNNVTTSSTAQLQIYPSLRTQVPENTLILTKKEVIMKCRYDTSTALGITYIDGILSDPGTVGFIEAL